jgi:hypothetical protein
MDVKWFRQHSNISSAQKMEDCRSYSNRLVVQRVHERNAKRVIVAKGGLREGDTETRHRGRIAGHKLAQFCGW